jgi:hypothetical protein
VDGLNHRGALSCGASSAWVPFQLERIRCAVRDESSPDGAVVADSGAVSVVNGEPSLINYLDALNSWQLVRGAQDATRLPAAASFKHVSPAGVAVAGDVHDVAHETWSLPGELDALTSAYVRARDADPKSCQFPLKPKTFSVASLTGPLWQHRAGEVGMGRSCSANR